MHRFFSLLAVFSVTLSATVVSAQDADTMNPVIAQAIDGFTAALESDDYPAAIDAIVSVSVDVIQNTSDRQGMRDLFELLGAAIGDGNTPGTDPDILQTLQDVMQNDATKAQQLQQLVRASEEPAPVLIGTTPEYSLTLMDGSTVTSTQLQGNIVVLDFWATWCGPCIRAMPHMHDVAEQYPDIAMYGVSLDQNRDALENWLANNDAPWAVAHGSREQNTALSSLFMVRGIPNIIILSPTGEVLWKGHPNNMDEPLAQAVAEYSS